jgi:hypothetical protein
MQPENPRRKEPVLWPTTGSLHQLFRFAHTRVGMQLLNAGSVGKTLGYTVRTDSLSCLEQTTTHIIKGSSKDAMQPHNKKSTLPDSFSQT